MIVVVDGFTFERDLRDTLTGHERAAYVTLYGAPFYDLCACFVVVRDGRVRALGAVTPGGELISLMRTAWGTNNDTHALFTHILKTGAVSYLECYDGKLPTLYAQYGFVVTTRTPFNDAYAAPTWNYARDGRPDYLTMTYQKEVV